MAEPTQQSADLQSILAAILASIQSLHDVNNAPKDSDKLADRCSVLRARINNCVGNVLIDSGAQISLISENFINKNMVHFKKVLSLPINNTTIKTATDELQKVNKQASFLLKAWSWKCLC